MCVYLVASVFVVWRALLRAGCHFTPQRNAMMASDSSLLLTWLYEALLSPVQRDLQPYNCGRWLALQVFHGRTTLNAKDGFFDQEEK
jgi:hypothetical protein